MPVVLDFDLLGALVGIEVIGVREYVGLEGIRMLKASLARLPATMFTSYDETADALTLDVTRERSSDQKPADGTFLFDPRGDLSAVFARW